MKVLRQAVLFYLCITLSATANVITKGTRELTEAILKSGGKQTTQEFVEFGGRQAIEEVLEKAFREGGDELVEKVVWYGRKYGTSALRTIDTAPSLYIKALDDLPESVVQRALWAAQREPETMTHLISQHGSDALLISSKHRGVGSDIVAKLSNDGIRMAKNLNEDQAIVLARYADELAALPSPQKRQVVDAIVAAPDRAISYMESHPKVFLTAAGISTLAAFKTEAIGATEEANPKPDIRSDSNQNAEPPIESPGTLWKLISGILIVASILALLWVIYSMRSSLLQKIFRAEREDFDPEEECSETKDHQEASAPEPSQIDQSLHTGPEETSETIQPPSPSSLPSSSDEEFPLTVDEIRKQVFISAFIEMAEQNLLLKEPLKWTQLVDETVRKLLNEGLVTNELKIYRAIAKGDTPHKNDYRTPLRYIKDELKEWYERQRDYEQRKGPRPKSLYIDQ